MPLQPISRYVWRTRYRYSDAPNAEASIEDTWRRVAKALASVEPRDQAGWAARFEAALRGFAFIPGGRVLAGAGTAYDSTLLNCFVSGVLTPSTRVVFERLEESAATLQHGGGIGIDFSPLLPRGTQAQPTPTKAPGPLEYMKLWDAMCATLLAAGPRRGAMMATLRCDHPDILSFIDAKRSPDALARFNLSVLVSDAFMEAVQSDAEWSLVFPAERLHDAGGPTLTLSWPGSPQPTVCRVVHQLQARTLWRRLLEANHAGAEPGVLFTDRINAENNLWYREHIDATNPCGEVPLPPYGACALGSLNLTRFVHKAFTAEATLDTRALTSVAGTAVRMLDNVIDLSAYPLRAQQAEALQTRRVGLGLTGLADALVMLGLRYDEPKARALAGDVMRQIAHTAYQTSAALAEEKGCFPAFASEQYLRGAYARRLPEPLRARIRVRGLRNSHLLAIAPAGTISLLAGNVSSGIEPVAALRQRREIVDADSVSRTHQLDDFAWTRWRSETCEGPLPRCFVTVADIAARDQLLMQAALAPHVDGAIAKTVTLPAAAELSMLDGLYKQAYALGLKGCTTYRPNAARGAVLRPACRRLA